MNWSKLNITKKKRVKLMKGGENLQALGEVKKEKLFWTLRLFNTPPIVVEPHFGT